MLLLYHRLFRRKGSISKSLLSTKRRNRLTEFKKYLYFYFYAYKVII